MMTGNASLDNPSLDNSAVGTDAPDTRTHFGFQEVNATEKASLVEKVFSSVAGRYDVMNDLMSLGIHRAWKGMLIDRIRPEPSRTLLDVGGGTGDIAARFLRAGGRDVTILDSNAAMLKAGRGRYQTRYPGIRWLQGDAEHMPLDDGTFDVCTISFCIRNVTRMDSVLQEIYRTLRPGGQFVCLEFSRVHLSAWRALYDLYSFRVLPLLGGVVARDAAAYRYLAESIRRFPAQESFATMIEEAGFERVGWQDLSGGIAALHWGWRL